MKKLLFAVFAALVLAACEGKDDSLVKAKEQRAEQQIEEKAEASAEMKIEANQAMDIASPQKASFAPPQDQSSGTEQKIVKEGDISFETENVTDTRKQLFASLKKLGGYATEDNEYLNGDNNRKQYVLNIRIPAKNFDSFLGTVSSTATKIDSKNIRVTDITTQYIDVKTRLDNKKALERRYLSLLDKANKMSDVLEIEAKLSEIRSDIESTQGQLNYMDKQVAYSSLSITFYTKQAEQADTGNTFGYKFKHALDGGFIFIQSLFFGVISWWPAWLLIIIIVVIIKSSRRKACQ